MAPVVGEGSFAAIGPLRFHRHDEIDWAIGPIADADAKVSEVVADEGLSRHIREGAASFENGCIHARKLKANVVGVKASIVGDVEVIARHHRGSLTKWR
jgi:hypothetical protein